MVKGARSRGEKRTAFRDNWSKVTLTPLEEADADALYRWHNAPGVRDLTMGFRLPVQRQSVQDWIRAQASQANSSRVVYAIRASGSFVGVVQLHSLDAYQRKGNLGVFVGDPGQRGNGIGTIASTLIVDYAFNGLDLRKVSLEVIDTNSSAIDIYEKIGFKLEGVKRKDYFVDGAYVDVRIYSILREEFTLSIPSGANRLVHSF